MSTFLCFFRIRKSFVFGFVYGRNWPKCFIFVSVSAEPDGARFVLVSFSAATEISGFGRSLVVEGAFYNIATCCSLYDCMSLVEELIWEIGLNIMGHSKSFRSTMWNQSIRPTLPFPLLSNWVPWSTKPRQSDWASPCTGLSFHHFFLSRYSSGIHGTRSWI